MKKIFLLLTLALLFSVTPRVVLAHASVVACAPHIGANLEKPPAQIVCLFDQPIDALKVAMLVLGPNGQRVDKNDTRPFEGDKYSIVVSLDTDKMTNGIYNVNWQVTDTLDAGLTSGTVQFGVNTVVPPTPTVLVRGQVIVTPGAPESAAPQSNSAAAELISRFLIGAGVVLLLAMGFVFWRTRAAGDSASDEA